MSAEKFQAAVGNMNLSENDKVWFPRWVQRYASSLNIPHDQPLPVTERQVIAFLREQRGRGTPAWRRLQAARAIETYRSNILQTDTPSLDRVRQTLERTAADKRHGVTGLTPFQKVLRKNLEFLDVTRAKKPKALQSAPQ